MRNFCDKMPVPNYANAKLKIKFKPDGKVISTYFQVLRSISIGKKKE
jgi:hypothetical protein